MVPPAEQQDRGHAAPGHEQLVPAARGDTAGNHEKGYSRHSHEEILTRIIIRHWVCNQSLLMVYNSGNSGRKRA